MRKIFYYFIFFFYILTPPTHSDIVYIDINKILNESIAGKKALGELEKNIKEKNIFLHLQKKN